MIEVNNLTKRYGATLAVDNVSFSADSGEIVGFIGPNGAGKSTTMRILTCYLPADEGSATVGGFDVFSESIEVRKKIGYLPESTPLYTDMGVIDYLKFVGQIQGLSGQEVKSRVSAMVDICGLEKMVHKDVGELSKGYRQRVGLAQALIHDPPVLILDEPTSGLDPYQIIEIRNLIKEFGREKTIIFSTHILSQVAITCDRVLIISNGKLVANGTPDELQQRTQDNQYLEVTLEGDQSEIETQFDQSGFIHNFQLTQNVDSSALAYEITSEKGHKTSDEIARLAYQNQWAVVSIQPKAVNLEEVFLRLTESETQLEGANS